MEEKPKTRVWLEGAKLSMNGSPPGGRGLEYYRKAIGDDVETFEGKTVLDLGAGEQLLFARGLENAGIRTKKTVSFSPAFANQRFSTEARIHPRDDAARTMVAGLGEHLPFADGTFDRIVCLNVLQHMTYPEAAQDLLAEAVRVLAPGGIAYFWPMETSTTKDGEKIIELRHFSPEKSGSTHRTLDEMTKLLGPTVTFKLEQRNIRERAHLPLDTDDALVLTKAL